MPPNPDHIAADWKSRGFSCELWTDPPGQHWEDFTHATDEIVIVLEGNMEFEVQGKIAHPQSGEELMVPTGTPHSARDIEKTTARWLFGYLQNSKYRSVSSVFSSRSPQSTRTRQGLVLSRSAFCL